TVAVSLGNLGGAVSLERARALDEPAGIGAEAHGAALGYDVALLVHERDHGELGLRVDLGGVGARHLAHVARELDDRHLHAVAHAEERHLALARVTDRGHLALGAARAEAGPDEDRVDLLAGRLGPGRLDLLRVDVADVHAAVVGDSAVNQR